LVVSKPARKSGCNTLAVIVRAKRSDNKQTEVTLFMTTSSKHFSDRINQLIDLANKTLASETTGSGNFSMPYVNNELYAELKTSGLSFILNLYGENHPYYNNFNESVHRATPYCCKEGRGILNSIKTEIDGGWLVTMKGLVSSEIFSDFIEMADHLLKEGYKDSAAVMIGSVLEEHLRQLCCANEILTEDTNTGKPKKADLLNAELAGKGVYNKLDQKSVVAWLDLRNKAAHGKYGEYNQQQVEQMLQAVTEFISRNTL